MRKHEGVHGNVGKVLSLFLDYPESRHRMFWWTEASISYINLSAAVTCEHIDFASSSTHLLLLGGVEHRENGSTSTAHHQIMQQNPGAITQLGTGIYHIGAGGTP
jgi:hypothetical protein